MNRCANDLVFCKEIHMANESAMGKCFQLIHSMLSKLFGDK